MSKGKRKRKQQRAKECAKQEATKAIFMNAEKIGSEGQGQNTRSGTDERADNKKPWWKRCATWIAEKSSFTDWCLMVFTGVLAGASIYQFLIMRGQLNEMQRQTEISERPWLSVQIKPQILNFVNGSQAVLAVKISMANVGKSIAKGIGIDVKLFPTNPGLPVALDAAENQRKLCNPPQPSSAMLFDLFPTNQPAEQVMDISVLPQTIANQSVKAAYPKQEPRAYVGFYVVGCVNYHSSFDDQLRQTRFAYHLIGPIAPSAKSLPMLPDGTPLIMGFEVGTETAGDKIGMMQELNARNDAN